MRLRRVATVVGCLGCTAAVLVLLIARQDGDGDLHSGDGGFEFAISRDGGAPHPLAAGAGRGDGSVRVLGQHGPAALHDSRPRQHLPPLGRHPGWRTEGLQVERIRNHSYTTPIQGWMSWAEFMCSTDCSEGKKCIGEALLLDVGRQLVRLGLRDAGYQWIWLDDCWTFQEREAGSRRLQAHPERFPHGIVWLADELHAMGLKFGIYLDYGRYTCQGQRFPGSEGFIPLDVATVASWKVDGIKLDGCFMSHETFGRVADAYADASRAIRATQRDMVFICSYPYYQQFGGGMSGHPSGGVVDWPKAAASCETYRFMDDVNLPPADRRMESIVQFIGNHQDDMLAATGPGHWPDADMLLLGSKLTSKYPISLQRMQLLMWTLMASPLLMSNDPSTLSEEVLALLTNPELLRIHTDPAVVSARRLQRNGPSEVWVRGLDSGDAAVGVINFDSKGQAVTVDLPLRNLGLPRGCSARLVSVFDAGAHATVLSSGAVLSVTLQPWDGHLYRVSVQRPCDVE